MTRRTRKMVKELEGIINNFLELSGSEERIRVQWAYGSPRCYLGIDGKFGKELSPRLPTGEMYTWLCAFIDGLDMGVKIGQDDSLAIEAIKESISIGYDIDIHAEGYASRFKYYVRLFFDGGVVAEEDNQDLSVALQKIGMLARQISRRGC